eukprot:symbB.v1.2.017753.t1/scaffold1389.1/size122275/2
MQAPPGGVKATGAAIGANVRLDAFKKSIESHKDKRFSDYRELKTPDVEGGDSPKPRIAVPAWRIIPVDVSG